MVAAVRKNQCVYNRASIGLIASCAAKVMVNFFNLWNVILSYIVLVLHIHVIILIQLHAVNLQEGSISVASAFTRH